MISEYVAHEASLGRSAVTVREYRKRLVYFANHAGTAVPSRITVDMLRRYHEFLMGRKLTTGSRTGYLSTLRGYLHWSCRQGLVRYDLSARVELPRPERKLPPTPLTVTEMVSLIEGTPAAKLSGKRNRAVLELLYACGLRHSELLGLDVRDVDFRRRRVFVRGKGSKDRILPVHEKALAALGGYLSARKDGRRRRPALFLVHSGARSGRNRLGSLRPLFQAAGQRLGKRLYPHLLRHTFAVHMLQGGANLRYVQALLGHDSPETTGRYLGLAKDDLRRAYDRATERMFRSEPAASSSGA